MKPNKQILFHLCIRDLSTGMSFGIAPCLAINILIGTSFIDRFIHEIILINHKILPRYSPMDANITRNQQMVKTLNTQKVYNSNRNDEYISDIQNSSFVHMARQVVFEPNMQNRSLVTAKHLAFLQLSPVFYSPADNLSSQQAA